MSIPACKPPRDVDALLNQTPLLLPEIITGAVGCEDEVPRSVKTMLETGAFFSTLQNPVITSTKFRSRCKDYIKEVPLWILDELVPKGTRPLDLSAEKYKTFRNSILDQLNDNDEMILPTYFQLEKGPKPKNIFTFNKIIAHGGFGMVVSYRNIRNQQEVALKFGKLKADLAVLTTLLNNTSCESKVVHARTITDFHGNSLLLMSKVTGTARALVSKDQHTAVELILAVAKAVQCLHKNLQLCYADLKPSNVGFLCSGSDELQIFLLDLGGMGTCQTYIPATYPAPESIERKSIKGEKDVVWSLGILWLLFLGMASTKVTYTAMRIADRDKKLQEKYNNVAIDYFFQSFDPNVTLIGNVIQRLLAFNPKQRITLEEAVAEIENLKVITAKIPQESPAVLPRQGRRRRQKPRGS